MQIGEKLKEARLKKGYTLEDVEHLTKIQTRHLQSIEKNNFSHIPGNFYARVFIKEYANVVDLDYRELLAEHKNEIPMSDHEIDYTQLRRSRKKSSSGKSISFARLLPTFIVIILLLGVGFFIWKTALDPNRTSNQGQDDDQTEQSVGDQVSVPPANDNNDDSDDSGADEPDEPEVDEEVVEEEPELLHVSYENNNSYYQFNTTDDVIELVIETTGRNWLEVESEAGDSLFYATLQASQSPETFDVSDEGYVYLRFGEPSVISISINDQVVELSDEIGPSQIQELWLYINQEPELE